MKVLFRQALSIGLLLAMPVASMQAGLLHDPKGKAVKFAEFAVPVVAAHHFGKEFCNQFNTSAYSPLLLLGAAGACSYAAHRLDKKSNNSAALTDVLSFHKDKKKACDGFTRLLLRTWSYALNPFFAAGCPFFNVLTKRLPALPEVAEQATGLLSGTFAAHVSSKAVNHLRKYTLSFTGKHLGLGTTVHCDCSDRSNEDGQGGGNNGGAAPEYTS